MPLATAANLMVQINFRGEDAVCIRQMERNRVGLLEVLVLGFCRTKGAIFGL